jgi:hypothetical protein
MTRVSAMALLVCAPLLMTQRVAAQDCFCGAAPTFGMNDAAPAPETPDTTIESSVVFIVAAAPAHLPAGPAVLWCTSGNDPRCMPMQSSDVPGFRALSAGPVAVAIELPETRVSRVARQMKSMTPAETLSPARGVQTSIDRPPRG